MGIKKNSIPITNFIFFTILIMTFSLFGIFPVNEAKAKKKFHMKVASQAPQTATWSIADKWYFDNVMANSGGRIKFSYFWAGSLTKVGEDLAAVRSGLEEIAFISPGYTPTELPLTLGLDMAYISIASDAKARAAVSLYNESEAFRNEWEKKNNCKLLYVSPSDILSVYSTKSIPTLNSIKGRKVRTYGLVGDALARLGATTVSLPISGSYEAASRGIVDAVSGMGLALGWKYKLHEPCQYVIDIGYGQYGQPVHVMNLDVWNSLPKDLQKLFMDWVPKVIDYTATLMERDEKEAIDDMVRKGIHIQIWSDSEKARAKTIIQPAQSNEWIKKEAKLGFDPKETKIFMERYLELVDKFERDSSWVDGFTYWQRKYGK